MKPQVGSPLGCRRNQHRTPSGNHLLGSARWPATPGWHRRVLGTHLSARRVVRQQLTVHTPAPCIGRSTPEQQAPPLTAETLPIQAGKDRQVHAAEDIGLCVQAEKEREREERVRRRVGEELRALEVKSQGKH